MTGLSLYYESFYFFATETENHCPALKSRNDPLPLLKVWWFPLEFVQFMNMPSSPVATADYHSDGVIINSDHSCDPLHVQCYVLLALL